MPTIVNGWFWSGSGARLGPTNETEAGAWSHTGGAKKPQPDNREFKATVREKKVSDDKSTSSLKYHVKSFVIPYWPASHTFFYSC